MSKDDFFKPNIESLFDDFDHPNPYINQQACIDMIRYWPIEAMFRLLENLDHEDLKLRRKTIKALGLFGMDILEPISSIFKEAKTIDLRISCIKVLVQVASYEACVDFPDYAMEVLELSARHEDPVLILTSIPLLKLLGDQGLPLLIELSKDPNMLRSSAANIALSEIEKL